MLKYLESLGDADPRYTDLPLTDAEQAAIAGDYTFGSGATERLKVAKNARGVAHRSQRPAACERNLFHQGGLVFNPAGAEAVRIRFDVADEQGARADRRRRPGRDASAASLTLPDRRAKRADPALCPTRSERSRYTPPGFLQEDS